MVNSHTDLRREISGIVVPLPMIFTDDLALDHGAISKYVEWCLDGGVTNLCLTYGYSQISTLTPAELMDVTATIARAVGKRGIFIGCTIGNSLAETVAAVGEMQDKGVDAVLVSPHYQCMGAGYRDFMRCLADKTELPLLFVNDPDFNDKTRGTIDGDDLQTLAEIEQIIGLKDEMRSVGHRLAFNARFGDRFCVIGPGIRHFLALFPHQAELDGFFNPSEAVGFMKLLEAGRLSDVHAALDAWTAALRDRPAGVAGFAVNQVCLYALGFGEGWQVRPTLVPATPDQARDIIARMRRHPSLYTLAETK